jgi:DNA polymerase III alpha subunit
MFKDKFGRVVLNENDLVDLYLTNTETNILNEFLVEDTVPDFSSIPELTNTYKCKLYEPLHISIEEYDRRNQDNWKMPKDYAEFDIARYVLDLCQNEEELQRAGEELILFQERGMFMLLRYLKYLVDIMRANNIVWGVGRGSSISSFVLYLIGVHKINPIYYDLPIAEFLRPE